MKSNLSVVRVLQPAPPRLTEGEAECRTTLWLDEQGRIIDCDADVKAAFGYAKDELAGSPVSRLVPVLADVRLVTGGTVNPRLAFRCRCGPFRLVDRDRVDVECLLFINAVRLPSGPAVALIVAQPPHTRYEARLKALAEDPSLVQEGNAASPATIRAVTA